MSSRADAVTLLQAVAALGGRPVAPWEARTVAAEFAGFCEEWADLDVWPIFHELFAGVDDDEGPDDDG